MKLYNVIDFIKAMIVVLAITTKQLAVILGRMLRMLGLVTYITLIKGHTVNFVQPGQEAPQEIETVTYVKPHTRIKRVKVNHYELGAVRV